MIEETSMTASIMTPVRGIVFPALRSRYVEGASGRRIARAFGRTGEAGRLSSDVNGLFYAYARR